MSPHILSTRQVWRRRDYERRGGSGRQLKLLAHGATGATGTRATGATGTLATRATGTRATGVTGSAANSERQEQRTHGRLEQRAYGRLAQRAHGRLAQRSHGRLELQTSRWPPPFNLPKLSHPHFTHPLLHPRRALPCPALPSRAAQAKPHRPARAVLLNPSRAALLNPSHATLPHSPAPPSRPPDTTATAARAFAAAGGGAAGSARGAGGAGPATDRHCLSWPLSRCVEAAALGSGESAAAPSASEFAAPLGAPESADTLGASASTATAPASTEALHTFTLDSSASRCFFRDCTIVTPLAALVLFSLADPTGDPDVWVDNFIPGGQRVAISTCSQTGRHLATFTRQPGSDLYTLTTESAQVAESGQVAASSRVSASGQIEASCSCRVLSHQTLLWHHRLGHPSLPRLRSMHSRLLVSGLPRSLPSLSRSLAPPCLPYIEGRQRAAPHSSEFPLTTTPLQTLTWTDLAHTPVDGEGWRCWVVRGFDQEQGRDFTETFAPVSRHTSLRILLVIAAMNRKKLRQIDVANAFLYAPVDAEISVELPHGSNAGPNQICQLKKSLYGIKQAPRLWQQHLRACLIRIGFLQLPHDQGMYRLTKGTDYILLIVYVDDLLYIGSTDAITTWFEGELQRDLTLIVATTVI
ncbi:unnamed protein product [Closterium sp. NIES-54]